MAKIDWSPALVPAVVTPGYDLLLQFSFRDNTDTDPGPLVSLTDKNVKCIVKNKAGVIKATLTVGSGIDLVDSEMVTDGQANAVVPGTVTDDITKCRELHYLFVATIIEGIEMPFVAGPITEAIT